MVGYALEAIDTDKDLLGASGYTVAERKGAGREEIGKQNNQY